MRPIGIARVARRLRRFGRGRAEIVRLRSTTSRKPPSCRPGVADDWRSRVQQPLARARRRCAHAAGGAHRLAGPARSRVSRVPACAQRRASADVATVGRRARAARAAGWRRGAWFGRASARALRAASASTLRIASSSASRSLVISVSDSAGSRAQLRDQRGARPLVERAACFAGVLAEPLDGAGDQRMIVGHR